MNDIESGVELEDLSFLHDYELISVDFDCVKRKCTISTLDPIGKTTVKVTCFDVQRSHLSNFSEQNVILDAMIITDSDSTYYSRFSRKLLGLEEEEALCPRRVLYIESSVGCEILILCGEITFKG